MENSLKYIKKSDNYKNVYKLLYRGKYIKWRGITHNKRKYFDTEREAAIFVDKALIELGKNPINILVRKQ
jgi:hypothetical protein